jgi:hypothetical protein
MVFSSFCFGSICLPQHDYSFAQGQTTISMTNAAPMKRLPPIDVLRPGHAHKNIVNVARIVSGLRWISDGPISFESLSSVGRVMQKVILGRQPAIISLSSCHCPMTFEDESKMHAS